MSKKVYFAVMSFFSAVAVMFSSMQCFARSPELPFTRALQVNTPSAGDEIEFKRSVNTDGTYFSGEEDRFNFVLVKSKSALDDFIRITIACPERYAVQYSEDYFKTGALIFFYGFNSYIGEYTRIESIVKPSPDTLSINAVYYYDDYDGGRTCVGDNLMSVYEISAADAEGIDNFEYSIVRKPYEKSDTRAHEKKSGENLPEDIKWLYEDTCMVYDDVAAGSVCSYFDGTPELYRNGEKLSFDGNLILKTGDVVQYKNEAGEVC